MLLEAMGPYQEEAPGDLLIQVWNRSGQASWEVLAAERLHMAGFDTLLYIAEAGPATRTQLVQLNPEIGNGTANDILDALGLDRSALKQEPQEEREADFRLVIGPDYDPCFDPTSR